MADIDLTAAMIGAADVFGYVQSTPYGPFLFAWVNPTETAFGPEHHVIDEQIFSFNVEQTEGDFATLSLVIRNPRLGLLAPSRKRWAWLSWNNGGTITPLFFGRLVGIPSDLQDELITLDFVARPADYAAQKIALAATLRVAPYYDPIWIAEDRRLDPDVVLEARPELWHIDRVSHVVTTSHILTGEDGVKEFPVTDVFHDSLKINLGNVPLRSVEVEAEIKWTQAGVGSVDLSNYIVQNWPNEEPGLLLTSFSGDGLISSWPKPDQNVGGGWRVATGELTAQMGRAISTAYSALKVVNGVLITRDTPPNSIIIPTVDSEQFGAGANAQFLESIIVPLWYMSANLSVKYDVTRNRSDRVKFTLSSDVQPIVTLPGEDESLQVSLSSVDVSLPLEEGGEPPIGDATRRAFLPTERGLQALEYLISLARANLIVRSRAVQIRFECLFHRATELSLRMNGRVYDGRIPGGSALGKIAAYNFGLNGDSGAMIGSVTIECPIGYGNAITVTEGTPTYVDAGYVDPGYQFYDGQTVPLAAGDVGYLVPAANPNDDGIDLSQPLRAEDIVLDFQVTNPAATQRAAIPSGPQVDESLVRETLRTVPTVVRIEFLPLTGGPFEAPYQIALTDLVLPQGVDLEADL